MPAPSAPGPKLTINEVAWLVQNAPSNTRAGPPRVVDMAEQYALATAIVMAESGGDTTAYRPPSRNPLGGEDRGLWQINSKAHPDVSDADAYNPWTATRHAFRMSDGFIDFGAWNVGPNSYGRDRTATLGMARARAAVAAPVDARPKLTGGGVQTPIPGTPVGTDFDRATDAALGAIGSALEWPMLLADVLRRLLDAALWRRIGIGAAGVAVIAGAVILAARSSIIPTLKGGT